MGTKDSGKKTCEEIENEKLKLKENMNKTNAWLPGTVSIDKAKALNQNLQNQISKERQVQIEEQCSKGTTYAMGNIISDFSCSMCNGGHIYDLDGTYRGKISDEELNILTNGKGKNVCERTDITQINTLRTKNECIINAMITDLMKVQDDIQAQAAAQLMQELPEVNNEEYDVDYKCQEINQNISQKEYLDIISKCAQGSTSIQLNILKHCGNASNVVQKNISNQVKECIINNSINKQTITNTTTDIDNNNQSKPKPTSTPKPDPKPNSFDLNILVFILIPVIIIFTLLSCSISFIMYSKSSQSLPRSNFF